MSWAYHNPESVEDFGHRVRFFVFLAVVGLRVAEVSTSRQCTKALLQPALWLSSTTAKPLRRTTTSAARLAVVKGSPASSCTRMTLMVRRPS